MKLRYSLLLLSLFIGTSITALDDKIDFVSIRQKAMGGVGVALFDTTSPLTTNPAHLRERPYAVTFPRLSMHLTDLQAEKSDEINQLLNLDASISDQIQAVQNLVPASASFRYQSLPIISLDISNFGLGLFAKSQFDGRLYNKFAPVLKVEGQIDMLPVVGYASTYRGTTFGLSGKILNRFRLYNKNTGDEFFNLGTSELLKIINDKADKMQTGFYQSSGLGFDFGVLRPIDVNTGKAQCGVVVKNIGLEVSGEKELIQQLNGVTVNQTLDVTHKIPTEVSVGIAFKDSDALKKIPLFGVFLGNMSMAADYDIVSEDTDFAKKLHLGIEKPILWKGIKFRGGVNDGYIVGGFGVDIKIWKVPFIHVHYANYVEELGEKIGHNSQKFQAIMVRLPILP